jgi:hypothetical protein
MGTIGVGNSLKNECWGNQRVLILNVWLDFVINIRRGLIGI